MTKALRWGVGTLSFVSLVALGAFVGCSSDDNNNPPPGDTDSGVNTTDSGTADTNKADSTSETTSETSSETSSDTADGDGAPSPPDRQVTFVFASPDSPPLYMCLGGFAADPIATDAGAPTKSLGPFGIPNDPTDPTKGLKSGFGFGAVVPYGVTDPLVKAALSSLTVVAYFSATAPAAGDTKYCDNLWGTTRTDPSSYFIVPKGKVVSGTSWLFALAGCKSAPAAGDTTNACPATPNFKYEFEQLDTAAPTTFSGDGTGAKAGLQFYNLSNFPAVFQNADVYIQPMTGVTSDAGADADGGTSTPAGTPILIAGGTGGGSKFEALSAPAVGVAPKGDPDSAVLLLVQNGTTPCAPSPTCLTTIALPLNAFEAGYKAAGIPIGWNGKNNTIVLAGSPLPKTAGDPTSAPLILAWVPNNF